MGKTEFTFDLSALQKATDELVDGGKEIVVAMATAQIANERDRAKKGIGLDDKKMAPYSSEYAEEKRAAGRQVDVRDLTFTGRTLRSRVQEPPIQRGQSYEVLLTFADAQSKLIAGSNQKRTPFFGVSDDDEKVLEAVAQEELDAIVSKLNKG